jgi:predicted signal transduction protein with EAL and GGDEF domain
MALYQAKEAGKDRHVLFSASTELTPEIVARNI